MTNESASRSDEERAKQWLEHQASGGMRNAATILKMLAAPVSERGSSEAMTLILAEVESARKKHPTWPANDTLFAAAIVSEESGELMRAAVQHKGEGGSLDACDKEAIQTAAVAIRFLERK